MKKRKEAVRYPERVTDIYLCVMLLVFPLWSGSAGYADMTEAKYGFFLWTALLYFAAILFPVLCFAVTGRAKALFGRIRRFSMTQIGILIYILFCGVSAVLSDYGTISWQGSGRFEGLGTILLYGAIFLLTSYFGRVKKWQLYLLGAVIMINTVIGVLQFSGGNPFSLYPDGYTYHDAFILYDGAFMGTLGNIDLLSAILSLAVPLLYAWFVLNEKSTLLLIPFALGVFLLLLTGVKAGLVGIGGGLFVTIPLVAGAKQGFRRALAAAGVAALSAAVSQMLKASYVGRITTLYFSLRPVTLVLTASAAVLLLLSFLIGRFERQIRWHDGKVRKIMAVCVAAVLVLVPAGIWAIPFKSGTMSALHRLLHGEFNSKLGSSRLAIWQQAIRLVPERLLFGGGPDTLAPRISFLFESYKEAVGTTVQTYVDTAHNDYLNILVNTGLLSLLAYLAALASSAVRTLKNAMGNTTALVLFTALLCYLIQIFFSFSLCIVSPFFWLFLGLLDNELRESTSRTANKRRVAFSVKTHQKMGSRKERSSNETLDKAAPHTYLRAGHNPPGVNTRLRGTRP